jgi:hypothetical protein
MRSKLLTSIALASYILLNFCLFEYGIINTIPVKGSPEYIRITGHLSYWDYANNSRPLVWARVWITDREPDGFDYIITEVFTDTDGYFDSGSIVNDDGLGEDGLDIGIYIVAWNWAVEVVDSDGIRYYGMVGPYNDLPDDTYYLAIGMPRGHGAWMIFSYHNGVAAGWDYLDQTASYEAPMVTCRWPYETWPHYHHGGEIHLPNWAAWYPDIVLHEYAHHVMYSLYGYLPQTLPEHYINETSDASTAWVEGWANFFPLAVQNDPVLIDWNLETPHWCSASWDDGDEVEGRVAGALWDIFDSDDDGYDVLDDGFHRIWNITRDENPHNFTEFWDAWNATYYTHPKTPSSPYDQQDWTNTLMAIFQNSIDYREPGDINADGIVDMVDLVIVADAFGAEKGDYNWDQRADIQPEWDLIDIVDIVYLGLHFGSTYDC